MKLLSISLKKRFIFSVKNNIQSIQLYFFQLKIRQIKKEDYLSIELNKHII